MEHGLRLSDGGAQDELAAIGGILESVGHQVKERADASQGGGIDQRWVHDDFPLVREPQMETQAYAVTLRGATTARSWSVLPMWLGSSRHPSTPTAARSTAGSR